MGKIWTFRAKKKINSKVEAGLIFQVPTTNRENRPSDSEIIHALEAKFGKGAGSFSGYTPDKYDIL